MQKLNKAVYKKTLNKYVFALFTYWYFDTELVFWNCNKNWYFGNVIGIGIFLSIIVFVIDA